MANASNVRWRLRDSLVVKIALPTVILVLVLNGAAALFIGWRVTRIHDQAATHRAERFAGLVEDTFQREMTRRNTAVEPILQDLCRAASKSAFVTDREGLVRYSCSPTLRGTRVETRTSPVRLVHHDGQWHLFYTGVNSAHNGRQSHGRRRQAILHATTPSIWA